MEFKSRKVSSGQGDIELLHNKRDSAKLVVKNYDVKIVGGKRVIIWYQEGQKKKKDGGDSEKKAASLSDSKKKAAPLRDKPKKAPGRPGSSDSLNSTYKTLPPIGSKAPQDQQTKDPQVQATQDLDRFVTSQLRGVSAKALEDAGGCDRGFAMV